MIVNICGIPHDVVECDDNFDVDCHMGMIDHKNAVIKINKDLKDDIEDELEKLLIEFTIYNTDMTEIILNRNNPDVVYALRRFIEERQKLKEIKKRLNNFVVKTDLIVK